jgi:hypothetical protein
MKSQKIALSKYAMVFTEKKVHDIQYEEWE